MKTVQVITDSCSDLPPELMAEYGVDYARMNTVRNGVVNQADLSWTQADAHEFYNIMRGGERVTTTQVPPEEFDRIFRKYAELGRDIVYISCSGKQSGSIYTAEKQAETLKTEFPDTEIICIDSLHASTGEGMVALMAAEYAREGRTAEETAGYAREMLKRTHEFCTVHSLDYLKRAGRVKAASAFFGNLMGVKPIIIANTVGDQSAVAKVKGRLNSFRTAVDELKKAVSDGAAELAQLPLPDSRLKKALFIAHADCREEELEQLRGLLRDAFGDVEIITCMMGPIIGASIGPEGVAVFGVGRLITDTI